MTHHLSYWNATAPASAFPALEGDIEADVAIVGGGIVGVTAARILKDRGLKVALVEALRVGEEVTGKSTAKITSQHNIAYSVIARKFGSCATVVNIDPRRVVKNGHEIWEVHINGGRVPTGLEAVVWARRVEELGAVYESLLPYALRLTTDGRVHLDSVSTDRADLGAHYSRPAQTRQTSGKRADVLRFPYVC